MPYSIPNPIFLHLLAAIAELPAHDQRSAGLRAGLLDATAKVRAELGEDIHLKPPR